MRLLYMVLLTLATFPVSGQPYTIRTVAGGGLPSLSVAAPGGGGAGVAVDKAGNLFFVGSGNTSVWRLDASTSLLTRVAGNGVPGFGGDGGPAINAQMIPSGIAVDTAGNLYIADTFNSRVRKVSNGVITTIAGNGVMGFSGDNGPAASAQLGQPAGIAFDSAGNIYIADQSNGRVRKVANGIISTVAGNGSQFFGGDNGPATSASVNPGALTFDAAGNLYIADVSNNRIRKVTNGIITTIAGSPGTGAPGSFSGDGGPATSAILSQPRGIAVDSSGIVYIADSLNNRIRKIVDGVITTLAGSGSTGGVGGFGGDNGPANGALLAGPSSVAIGPDGTLYIGDSNNSRVRKVSFSSGAISTAVGGNSASDNGPATSTSLYQLAGVTTDSSGLLYFADSQNRSIRKVSSGVITTVAGGGLLPDSFPAIAAQISGPNGVAVDSAGNLYISDNVSNNVRKVSNGIITTVAGNGSNGYSGDGGPGTSAQLAYPSGIAVDSGGNIYIADTNNNRVRKLSNGVITTIAGNGTTGFGGDNGPAIAAQLNFPSGLAVDAVGTLYIADGNRIRKVSNGVITTVAGGTIAGFSGDNGPATSAQLNSTSGIAVDPAGNLYIADAGNLRMRKVSGGIITTIAGNGTPGLIPDNNPATSGGLGFFLANQPFIGVAADSAGNVYFTDSGRVRILTPSAACSVSARPLALQTPATGGNLTISIQTDPGCPWSIGGLPDWLSVVSATPSGSGLAAATLFATGNTSGRSATFFAGNNPIKVDQLAGSFGPASLTAVLNSGSNRGGPVAPGEIVVVYGTGIGPAQLVQFHPDAGLVATSLAGTQLFFNGIAAPLIYSSATQVAAIVPYGISGVAQLTATYAPTQGFASALVAATAAAPGVFTADSSGRGQAAVLNMDGSPNSATNPAGIGSFISLYVTGEGQTWPAGLDGKPASDPLPRPLLAVGVVIGGKNANVTYSGGAPGLVAGLMQINAQIPTGITAGNSVPVAIQIGGILAQTEVTIAVNN